MGQLSALVRQLRTTPDGASARRKPSAPAARWPTHPRIEPSWPRASRNEGREAAVMKVAVVTAAMRSGERGGAEALYAGLVAAVRAAGHDVSALEIPIDESNFEAVLASYSRCYDADVSGFDVVISTKAPTYMVRHPRHVSYLLHTLRVFYDRFDAEYGNASADAAGTAPADPPARQGRVASRAGARTLRQRADDVRAAVRRRLVVEAGPVQGAAPSAGARQVPAAAPRRVRVPSGPAASMEACGPGRPRLQAAEAQDPVADCRDRRGRAAPPHGGRRRPADSIPG